jgi:hypothetical protein
MTSVGEIIPSNEKNEGSRVFSMCSKSPDGAVDKYC